MTTRKVTPRGTCCSLRPCLQLLQLHSHVHKPHLIDVHPHPQNGTVIGAQTAELRRVVSPGPGGSKPGERMFKLCRTEGLLRFSLSLGPSRVAADPVVGVVVVSWWEV